MPTIELLVRAEEDENVKAIILRINSPGGAVGPTQEIFEEIRRIDGAWDKTKNKEGNLFMEVLEQLLPVGVTIWRGDSKNLCFTRNTDGIYWCYYAVYGCFKID